MAKTIISYFPGHSTYCEVFGGAMSVLLQKRKSKYEVYNDADGDVVNFFRQLREQPERLIWLIGVTPYAREEFELSLTPTADLLERARRFYVRCCQSRGIPKITYRGNWLISLGRNQNITKEWAQIEHLVAIAERLKHVHLENDDWGKVLDRFDRKDTLFYVDPPYLPETRSSLSKEGHEWYARTLTADDHHRLANALNQISGMAVVSGYPSALYDEWYCGWTRIEIRARDQKNNQTVECLWLNSAASAETNGVNLSLF